MAFDYFARARRRRRASIETGLGGRLDSTNVVKPLVAGVTSIGLDHTEYLGDTLEEIAREKAGIFKRGAPAVIGERDAAHSRGCSPSARASSARRRSHRRGRDCSSIDVERRRRGHAFDARAGTASA